MRRQVLISHFTQINVAPRTGLREARKRGRPNDRPWETGWRELPFQVSRVMGIVEV